MFSVCCRLLQDHLPPTVAMATKGQRPIHRADQLEYVACVPTTVFRYKCCINYGRGLFTAQISGSVVYQFLLLCLHINAVLIPLLHRLSILAMNVIYHMSRGGVYASERLKLLASERYVGRFHILSAS